MKPSRIFRGGFFGKVLLMKMKITELENQTHIPFHLLLMADPDLQKVKAYAVKNKIFATRKEGEIIGVYVLEIKNDKAEILNIAVAESFQNKGIGQQLIGHAVEFCKREHVKRLNVGTGSSSISQIAFYQKCGFRIDSVIKDYFLENYKEAIFENGIQCRDMVRFEMEIE